MVSAAELEAAHAAAAHAHATAAAPAAAFPALPVADPFPSLGGRSVGPAASSASAAGATAAVAARGQASGAAAAAAAAPAAASAPPKADDFPALGGPVRAPVWTGSAPVIHRTKHTTTLVLPTTPGLAAKVPQVLARLRAKYGKPSHAANTGLGAHANAVTIEASTTQKLQTTTFILKSASEKALAAAKKELSTSLAQRVTLTVPIPAGLRAHVIGAKGKTLRSITDATGVKVNIPKATSEAPAHDDEDDWANAEQIDVTVEGDEINARAAREQILALVAERTSKITQRLAGIDRVYFPFLAGPKNAGTAQLETEPSLGNSEVKVRIPPPAAFLPPKDGAPVERERDLSLVVSGERDAVQHVVAHIQNKVAEMKRSYKTLTLQLPKRQHRFLIGENASDVLAQTGCSIEIAPASDKSDVVTLRGPAASLPHGLSATITKANAVAVESADLAAGADDAHAAVLARWLRTGHIPSAEGVQVYLPREGSTEVEITGPDAEAVAHVRDEVAQLVQTIPPSSVGRLSIDPLLYRHIIGKKAANLKKYEAQHVQVLFPPEASAQDSDDPAASEVLLVFAPPPGQSPADAAAVLKSVREQLEATAATVADMESLTLKVPAKLHRAILGPNGTTLNALIGEEKSVAVTLGSTGKKSVSEDEILIRGPSSDAHRVADAIKKLAQEAEQDAIVNGFQATLQVDATYVPHLIGKSGAAISKLRDELGVKVDVGDAPEGIPSKKRSAVPVILTGRKENVTEAERRLRAQIERLEDETSVTLKIDPSLHGALIGQGGKYVTRLQDKYAVRIDFPRASGAAEPDESEEKEDKDSKQRKQKADEVIIRGGKKGVASAKAEVLELAAYETEHNNTLTLPVPPAAVSRILGRAGSHIAKLRDDSGAQIDLDHSRDAEQGQVKIRGTKEAIAMARKEIEKILAEVDQEVTYTVEIPSALHGQLIGQRGSGVRDIVIRAGGEESVAAQYVSFPRRGSQAMDEVLVRAPAGIANKIRAELEKAAEVAAARAAEITNGVRVPSAQHRTLIGKGGSRLREFEAEHSVRVFFPGSKLYGSAPSLNNASELEGVALEEIVKVRGAPEAVQAASEALSKSAAPGVTKEIQVPEALSRQVASLKLLRSLRSELSVTVDLPKGGAAASASVARIDDEPEMGALTVEEVDLSTKVTWTLHGRDEESLSRAESQVDLAVEEARAAGTFQGTLNVPSSAVGMVVGRQGRTLKTLESETGAHITVSREGGLISLSGSEDAIREAAERIQDIVERD